jgi:hypothetical protein
MDKKVIIFNGPPQSGKDTATIMASNFLAGKTSNGGYQRMMIEHLKFADPLKAAAHQLFGIPYSCNYYEKNFGNSWKDSPQIEFYGLKPRDVYIALSEDFAKKIGGVTFFGRIAARRIGLDKVSNVFIFSDGGFVDEIVPVISTVGVQNVIIIELYRDGTSFDGDSRNYIGDQLNSRFGDKILVKKIPNNQDLNLLRLLIRGILTEWLEIDGEDVA